MDGHREGGQDRRYTKSELERIENLERLVCELERDGYRATELTIPVSDVNREALVLGGAFVVPLVIAFLLINAGGTELAPGAILIGAVASLLLVPVHEGIHGIVWGAAAPSRFKAVRFGFIKQYLTPYCTCVEPLTRGTYLAGCLAPFVVLGLAPCLAAIAAGSEPLMLVGALMILGAGGDLAVARRLLRRRNSAAQTLCLDHPADVGLVVFER